MTLTMDTASSRAIFDQFTIIPPVAQAGLNTTTCDADGGDGVGI
jgi:hypothetical protein